MLARVGGAEHSIDHEQSARDGAAAQRDDRLVPAAPDAHLASAVGNSAFGAIIGRAGAGILPDGRAHPDVEATIARSRGGGASLDTASRERFAPALGDDLRDVRVHTDATSAALAHSVSAHAFATGSDLFFASGQYRPGTRDGDGLLAHELTHVVQQRGAAVTGPLTVSEPGDPAEHEADRIARDLTD
jgi:hypothetical protein